jgi:hypothetical protein
VSSPATIQLTKAGKRNLALLSAKLGKDELYREITQYFERKALMTSGRITRDFLSGQRLKRRRGNLARAMTGRGELVGGVPALRVGIFKGPALKYAGPQELGTKGKNPSSPYPTIRQKPGGPALSIPIGKALTPSGVAKVDSPRDWPRDLDFVPMYRGRFIGLLVERTKTRSFPVFKLMSAVDIAPKFYLRDGFADALPDITDGLAELLARKIGARKR